MSYPPPPGLSSSASQPPASLPARPPPSAINPASNFIKPPSNSSTSKTAFTAFAPRSVASSNTFRTNSPAHYSAAPVTSYSGVSQYSQAHQQQDPSYNNSQPNDGSSYNAAAPQIRNPFVQVADQSSTNQYEANPNYDPDYEAQIQQWQSAYMNNKDSGGRTNTATATLINSFDRSNLQSNTTAPSPSTSSLTTNLASSSTANSHLSASQDHHHTTPSSTSANPNKTVTRSGGGTTWTDSSLLEWDPAHFRIFVGNLAGEVTDESLLKAFSKYPSVQKARVIRDKRTTKSRGYGFVSFSDGDDYFQAAREMQGKYIGSHPVLIKRSTTEVKASNLPAKKGGKYNNNNNKKNGKFKNGDVLGTVDGGGGIQKKSAKMRGGLKVLG